MYFYVGVWTTQEAKVPSEIIDVGGIRIIAAKRIVFVRNEHGDRIRVRFGPKQYAILEVLAERLGHYVSTGHIQNTLWPEKYVKKRSPHVRVLIHRIRSKIRLVSPESAQHIWSKQGRGFALAEKRPP